MTGDRLRLAVIGTGAIARRFAADLRYSQRAIIRTVGARDPKRAQTFAHAIGSDVTGHDIEAAIAAVGVDAVYVATANAVHAEHAELAIRHGKPVLVEKPFASTANEAERLAELARSAGVFAMEAMWARFTPGNRRLKSIVERQELGALRRLQAEIAYFDPTRGDVREPSGALLDLGVYPVSLAMHLLGPVARVVASGIRDSEGVVRRAELLLEHDEAFSALSAAWDADATNRLTLIGTAGSAEAAAPLFSPPILALRKTSMGSGVSSPSELIEVARRRWFSRLGAIREAVRPIRVRRVPTFYEGTALHYQVDHMAAYLRAGRLESEIMPLSESCAVLRVIDEAAKQIG